MPCTAPADTLATGLPDGADDDGADDGEGDGGTVRRGVAVGLGEGEADGVGIADRLDAGDDRRATATAPKARIIRTTSATCDIARSSGHRACAAGSR